MSTLDENTPVDCQSFYKTSFGLDETTSNKLCGANYFKIDKFSFADKQNTVKAWMNIYLNNETYNAVDYSDLVFAT